MDPNLPRGPAPRFVVVGDVMTDVVAAIDEPLRTGTDTPGRIQLYGGGSAANTAHWLAAGGHTAALVVRVGADPFGPAAVAELREAGVDVRAVVDPDAMTGTCLVVVVPGGERTMVPDAGANLGLAETDLPADLLRTGDHLHLSGYALLRAQSRPAARAMLAAAAAAGMTTSIDAASAGPIQDLGPADVLEWFAGVDVLLANEDEARVLAGALGAGPGPAEWGRALAGALRALAVVKLGPGGALAVPPAGAPAQVAARQVAVVDSTGAGDAFAAGFLPAHRTGHELRDALEAGARTAALAIARRGGRPAPPS